MQVRPISVERYRQEANRLRAEAENTHDLTTRNELRAIASKYDVLADSVERMFGHLSEPRTLHALQTRPPPNNRKPRKRRSGKSDRLI